MKLPAAVTALIAATAALVLAAVTAPPARAQQGLLEVIDVPSSGTRVVSNTVLRPGHTYFITVSGRCR